jgi:LuxR family quorum sensing-dependent transcriptional regulator
VRDTLRDALDVVDAITRQSCAEEVLNLVHDAVSQFGCDGLMFLGLPARNQSYHDVVVGKRLPEEWARTYEQRQYLHSDPIVRQLRGARRPFEWKDVCFDSERFPRSREVMHVRADFGFRHGFVVPVPGPRGASAGVFMGGERPDFPAHVKPALHMMSLYAFERISDLQPRPRAPDTGLTSREREVLTWTAAGKSAWEIGAILSISTRTVNEHAQTAMRKLGAGNRTHAVALALRDGLISV